LTEAQIQKELVKWFKCQYPDYDMCLQASLNGINIPGNRAKVAIIINAMKAQGMVKGQSDIFLSVPRHGYHGKYIELKTDTGKPTEEQLKFIDKVLAQGYCAEIVRGLESAKDAIKSYLE
jgi:hypothetical protein